MSLNGRLDWGWSVRLVISGTRGTNIQRRILFTKAAKAKPADARVHLAYAHFLKAINNPHGVLPEYRKAYKLDPSFRYVEALVTAYVEKRYYLDAWKLIQKHVAQSPNDERLWPMYGYVALRLRHYPEAEGIYKKLLKKYPESRGYLFSLGDALFYQTKFEEADNIYTQLYQADSNDSGALIAYIQIKHAMAELKPAQEALKKLYALHASGQFKEPAFCREIMFTESHQIEVFESFKLEGDRAVKYTFRVWRDKKDDYQYLYRITLGRYKETNHEARKQGQLKDGEELYQLDLHNDDYREYTTMQYIKAPPAVNYVRLRNGIMRHVMNEEAKQKAEAAEAAKADESSQDTTGE